MSDWKVADEFFYNGVRYYTQEQLDAAARQAEQRGYGRAVNDASRGMTAAGLTPEQKAAFGFAAAFGDDFAAGVQAARDAVAGLSHWFSSVHGVEMVLYDDALAAIDALRGDGNG